MMDPSKECAPNCDPADASAFAEATVDKKAMEGRPENFGGESSSAEASEDKPTPEVPPLPESRLTQAADTLVLVMFVVGIYSQIFSLFLYAFGNSA